MKKFASLVIILIIVQLLTVTVCLADDETPNSTDNTAPTMIVLSEDMVMNQVVVEDVEDASHEAATHMIFLPVIYNEAASN